jgi:hypothetical protein
MKRFMLFVLLGGLALASAAHAQVQTGNVIGTVTDESGGALPGAMVTLSAPGLADTTQYTSATGEYRFIFIENGIYTLTVTLDGFQGYTEADFVVSVGATTARDVALNLGVFEESIVVTGASPMVDPRRFGVQQNVKRETIDVLPTRHDRIMEFGKWTPGVSANDPTGHAYDLAVLGSTTGENTKLIDGAPQQGRGDPETVEEIQAITLGASSEYQVAQGGVFNVVTKSGTNLFKVNSSIFFHPDDSPFGSTPTLRPAIDGTLTGYHMPVMNDWGIGAAGPLVLDKLWIFGHGNWFHREETQPGVLENLKPPAARVSHGMLEKVDWRIKDSLAFKQMFFWGNWKRPEGPGVSNEALTGITVVAPVETIRESGGNIYATFAHTLTATLNPQTLLEVRVNGTWNPDQYQRPLSGDYVTPIIKDTGTGLSCCGVSSINTNSYGRTYGSAKINRFFQGARLSNELRGGVQLSHLYSDRATAWPSGMQIEQVNGVNDEAEFRGPDQYAGRANHWGVWIEDQLTVDRLTLMFGGRFDHSRSTAPETAAVDDLLVPTGATIPGVDGAITYDNFAPRMGGNLGLTDDGRLSLRFSAGRSYDDISATGDVRRIHPGLADTTLAQWDPATNAFSTIISVTDPTRQVRVDFDQTARFTDAYSIGVDRELMPAVAVGATYVYKRGNDYLGQVDTGGIYAPVNTVLPDGRSLTIFDLQNATSDRIYLRTNGPGTFSRYHGLVLTLEKRLSNYWQGNFAYTRSFSEGLTSTGRDPNDQVNKTGRLSPMDRPNMFTGTSTFQLPRIDAFVTASYMHMGGRPYSPQVRIKLNQGNRSINIDPPGELRFDAQNYLALRYTQTIARYKRHRFLISAQLTNVFQDQGAQSVITRRVTSSNFNLPFSWIQPRRLYFQFTVR